MVSRIFALLMFAGCVSSYEFCGGNCPGGHCPECLCSSNPYQVNIAQWCSQLPWDQACCMSVMTAESNGNANAIAYDQFFYVGLFKIKSTNWQACNNGIPPCDLIDNLRCAYQLWKWGSNTFRLWGTAPAGCV